MKFMPHEYQKYAIEYIKSHPVTALFLDMGLGKTVTTLTAIRDLMYDTLKYSGCWLSLRCGWRETPGRMKSRSGTT